MNRIPDYPFPGRTLDGSEVMAGWQDGQQVAVPAVSLMELADRHATDTVNQLVGPALAAATAAAEEMSVFNDALAIDATEVVGRPAGVPLVDGSATNAAQAYFLEPVERAGTITTIDLFDRAAGTVEIAVFRMVNGLATLVSSSSATTLGGNVERRIALASPLPIQPGNVPGLRATAAGLFAITVGAGMADGAGYFLGPQAPFPSEIELGGASTNVRLQVRLNIEYREQVVTAETFEAVKDAAVDARTIADAAAVEAEVANDRLGDLVDVLSEEAFVAIGRPLAPIADGSLIQTGQAFFLDPVEEDGVFASVDVFDRAPGTAQVAAVRKIDGVWTRVGLSTITTLGGNVQRTCPIAAPFPAKAGDIGVLKADTAGMYTLSVDTPADGAGYFLGPPLDIPETPAIGAATTNLRIEARINVAVRRVAPTAAAFADLKSEVRDAVGLRGSPRRILAADVRPAIPTSTGRTGLISHGQSQSTAYQAQPASSTVQPYANLTFAGGVGAGRAGNTYGAVATVPGMSGTKPLVEADTSNSAPGGDGSPVNGETICTTAASTFVELAALQDGIDPASNVVFASASGHAGYSIAKLSKGSPWYGSLIDHITRAAELAAAAGKSYALPFVYYVQGADDARDGQSTAYWRTAFLKLVDDVNVDGLAAINAAMAAAGLPEQTAPIHFLLSQTASPYYEGTLENLAKIRQAQFECINASPLVHFGMPEASLPAKIGDWLHYSATSQIRAGRHVGRAMKQLVVDGCEPDCVWPVSALATETTVRIKFRVPAFPLVLDEATFGALTDRGFRITDATGNVPIVSVAVSAPGDEVVIELGRALGASPVVRHGFDYIGSTNNHFSSANGCLRDSTPATTTIAGVTYPLWHVAPSFALPVYQVKAGGVIDPTDAKAVAPTGAIGTADQIVDTPQRKLMTAAERGSLAQLSDLNAVDYHDGVAAGVASESGRLAWYVDRAGRTGIGHHPDAGASLDLLHKLFGTGESAFHDSDIRAGVKGANGLLAWFVDLAGKVGIGHHHDVAATLDLLATGRATLRSLLAAEPGEFADSGIPFGVRDAAGRLALYVHQSTGGDRLRAGLPLDLLRGGVLRGALRPAATSSADLIDRGYLDGRSRKAAIAVWGDSTAQQYAATQTVWDRLQAARPTLDIYRGGVASQRTYNILTRMGAVSDLFTIANNTIPTSATVNIQSVYQTGSEPSWLNGRTNYRQDFEAELAGVRGVISVPGTVGGVAGQLTFTRSLPGPPVTVPAGVPIPARLTRIGYLRDATTILMMGQNNATLSVIQADLEKALRWIDHDRYLIVGLINTNGSSSTQLTINAALARQYGDRFLDQNQVLIDASDGSAEDTAMTSQGRPPARLFVDGLHINDAGAAVLAPTFDARLTALRLIPAL